MDFSRPLCLSLMAAAVAGCASAGSGPLLSDDPQAACEALGAVTIASRHIAPAGQTSGGASVDSATFVAAAPLAVNERPHFVDASVTPAAPAFCKVVGRIAPVDPNADPIRFQVNLPVAWSGRSVQFGGGGFNVVLVTGQGAVPGAMLDAPGALARGYATVGTDSGHETRPGRSPMAFALNQEMLVNFGHAAYPKVRNVSVALMKRAYGRAPDKLYFVGSSEGGREGLTMAQRYPEAFDGIFSRVPVISWSGLQFAGTRAGAATFGEGWMDERQVKWFNDRQLGVCDALDGAADGIISNIEACRSAFSPRQLLCQAGASGDCLNEAQVKAIELLRAPFRFPFPLANGMTEYPGWGIGGESLPASGADGGWSAWWMGSMPPHLPPKSPGNGIAWIYGSGALQHFYAQDPSIDPRPLTADPTPIADRILEISALMDSTDPDLSAFHARGGKLIVLEYLADYAQSPYAGIRYVESVERRMGNKSTEFLRLYTAPGVDHTGTGAPARVDMLGALEAWVERGQAPAGLTVAEQEIRPPFAVRRTRPLCEWPNWPRYQGRGDIDAAASFECVR